MAYEINQTTPAQAAKIMAQSNLQDTFKKNSIEVFYTFSDEIYQYLMDYFCLLNDLRTVVNEEVNRKYHDYCFLIVPVHKAFEAYLTGMFKELFNKTVSFKKNETVGYYLLNTGDKEKKKCLDFLQEKFLPFKPTLSTEKWIKEWKALAHEWEMNRNPLTHSGGEKMDTIRQAESTAGSILREMDSSAQLFAKEFFEPLVEYIKKNKESKSDSTEQ